MSALQMVALGVMALCLIIGVPLVLALPYRLRQMKNELAALAAAQKEARQWTAAELSPMQTALARVAQLEKRIQSLEQRLEEVALQGGDGRPYQQAIRMVQRGASIDDLVADCELSPGEAELIISLHGERRDG